MSQRRRVLSPQRSLIHLWGSELRAWRDRRGLSLAELGARIFYDASHLGKFERGERVPPRHVAEACDRELDAGGGPIRLRAMIGSSKSDDCQDMDEANRSGDAANRVSPTDKPPAQLPADVVGFSGRAAELTFLNSLVNRTEGRSTAVVIAALTGTAGVGKTTLAVHWAHLIQKRFPDGQLYVNLRGFDPTGQVKHPSEAVRGFLHSLGVPPERIPDEIDAQAAMYRSLLNGRRALVILDNARDSEQVRPLLPGSPGCLVVVTSRSQLAGLVTVEGAHLLDVDLLTPDESQQLLVGRLGQDRVGEEPEAVERLIQLCVRLPLALAIVAARAARHPSSPMSALASELELARNSLEPFSGGEPDTDIRAVFSWSYQTLSTAAARLFRLLSLHPGPDMSVSAAASLVGIPEPDVRPLLNELTQAHLIEEDHPGRYAFHDLLRKYSGELARTHDSETERDAATHRIVDHYLHTLASSQLCEPMLHELALDPPHPGTAVDGFIDHEHAMRWFASELPAMLPIVKLTVDLGLDGYTCRLGKALSPFFDFHGYFHEWRAVLQEALGAAGRLADQHEQAFVHRCLACAAVLLGRYDDAHASVDEAFELDASALGSAHAHQIVGWIREREERYTEAIEHAERAHDLYRVAGYIGGQAHALNDRGFRQALLGNHEEALANCRAALDLAERIDHPYEQAASWRGLGYAHHHLGHHAQATHCFERAIQVHGDIGSRRHQAEALHLLGDTFVVSGQPEQARDAWLRALAILDDLHHVDADHLRLKLDGLKGLESETARGSTSRHGDLDATKLPIRQPGA